MAWIPSKGLDIHHSLHEWCRHAYLGNLHQFYSQCQAQVLEQGEVILITDGLCCKETLNQLTRCTSDPIGVPCITWDTLAYTSMIDWGAISILCTITWVYTLFISACFGSWAFWVCQALILPANIIWISSISWQAVTFCSVISNRTFSICTTSFPWAGILTLPLDACKM